MKKHNLAAAILFCGFLAAIALGFLIPKPDFSEMEKRYLAKAPAFGAKTVFSGQWGKEAETYLTDHIPCRNLFVGIHAYLEKWAGRQNLTDIRVDAGKLLEAPVPLEEAAVARNMKAINTFAEKLGQPVHLTVVPSAGWAAGAPDYTDEESIHAVYAAAGEGVIPVDVCDVFAGRPELYYNTDHHWTSRGAYLGYVRLCDTLGRGYPAEEDFTKTMVQGFQGSTYSRSALWLTPGEPVEMWQHAENLTVTNGENPAPHEGNLYPERLETADKYTVFLDGNHSIVRVTNPGQTGKLLVIRDSYSNCLGGFLAESYGEVVLADLRYYRAPLSQLAAEENFDDILVLYSCANFLTDTNLPLLR